jgi:hypothetical protein
MGADGVLLVHQEDASSDVPGTSVEVQVGPVDAPSGYGISLACSGPGDVTYRVMGEPEDPVTKHCQDRFTDDRGAPGLAPTQIRLEVMADAATSWRLVIYDPPPSRYSREGGSG